MNFGTHRSLPILKKIFFLFVFITLFSFYVFARPGRLDLTFPQILAVGGDVTAIEFQPDGKILIAGKFLTMGSVIRKDIARLNADGSVDPTFDAGTGTDNIGTTLKMRLQPDGKLLICGTFNTVNGTFHHAVARLNANGTVDTTFTLTGIDITYASDMDLQTNGKVLVSGSNLIGSSFITRLTPTGANDQGIGQPLFSVGGGTGYKITYIPADDKILVGGRFSYAQNQNGLVRLTASGFVDSTFTANITNSSFDSAVATKVLSSGKILVFGKFDTVNQTSRRNVAILNSDGSLDTSFVPPNIESERILDAAMQPDGKVIIAGRVFAPNSLLNGNIARLNANGSVDTTFIRRRGANDAVKTVKIRDNNKLLIGGTFFRYDPLPRAGLAQLNL